MTKRSEPRQRGQSSTARANDPSLLILTSLASGPKHGYALFKDIEEFSGAKLGPGTLYGAIARLEERGMIEPTTPAGRTRPYRLTASGRAELERLLGGMRSIVEVASLRLAGTKRSRGWRAAAAARGMA